MSFSQQVVVVPGATGVVGSGAVRAYLDAGATVVGVSRSAANLDTLRETIGIQPSERFLAVTGDFHDEASAGAAKEAVSAALDGRAIDHVVSSVGFVLVDKAPTDTSLATLRKALDDGLINNFLVAKAFLPDLAKRQGSSYTLVSGGLAHFPPPSPTLWLGTLKNASVNALTYALASEMAQAPTRVNTLCIHFSVAPVGGDKNQFGMPAEKNTLSLGPAFVGLARGTSRAQVVCLHGWDDVEKLAAS